MPIRPRKILIVDDDTVLLEMSARLLEQGGFEVATCSAKFNRLNLIFEQQPNLVLLDINMPFLPGDEILRLMREDVRLRNIPVVIFSSNDEGELRRLVAETGAHGYIPKSDVGAHFAAKVGRLLQRIEAAAKY
jgi:DNA-binding response OmpR family regulator